MSHTPGPWKWEETGDGLGGTTTHFVAPSVIEQGSDGHNRPKFVLRSWGHDASGINVDEADAHLIAAAPELLEALEAAIEVMEEDLESVIETNTVPNLDGPQDMATLSDEAKPYVEELTAELESAKKAVAKAKGVTA